MSWLSITMLSFTREYLSKILKNRMMNRKFLLLPSIGTGKWLQNLLQQDCDYYTYILWFFDPDSPRIRTHIYKRRIYSMGSPFIQFPIKNEIDWWNQRTDSYMKKALIYDPSSSLEVWNNMMMQQDFFSLFCH